ncbi:MAG: hypothetical protein JWL65_4407, partial [Gammaproteobacteria bacterium]|nr:hypothetical protein [Gammaproteobacteria bacterium]
MKSFTSRSALALAALTLFIGGCVAP